MANTMRPPLLIGLTFIPSSTLSIQHTISPDAAIVVPATLPDITSAEFPPLIGWNAGFSIKHTISPDAAIVVPAVRSAEFPPLGADRSYRPTFFLDLPGEIRNTIYRYALTRARKNEHNRPNYRYYARCEKCGDLEHLEDCGTSMTDNSATNLLRASKQVWQEATTFLYISEFVITEIGWSFNLIFEFFQSMGQTITLVESVRFYGISLNNAPYETSVFDMRQVLGLLGRSTRCHSLQISKLFFEPFDARSKFIANNYFDSRELARLLFPTFRAWFENMDQGGQDWKSSFMANQGDMEFEVADETYHMLWDRSDFCEEIDRLLQNAEGMWIGTIDGEANILWTNLSQGGWAQEWAGERAGWADSEQLPIKKVTWLMERWWLPTRNLRRVFHMGDYSDA